MGQIAHVRGPEMRGYPAGYCPLTPGMACALCACVFFSNVLCVQRDDFMEVSMVMMICAQVEQVDKQVDTLILHTLVGSLLFTQLKTDSGFWA